jgi:hypothetical protein
MMKEHLKPYQSAYLQRHKSKPTVQSLKSQKPMPSNLEVVNLKMKISDLEKKLEKVNSMN